MAANATRWLHRNLFATPLQGLATVTLVVCLCIAAAPVIDWAVLSADWVGSRRADCTDDGACWVFIGSRIGQFLYGFYPEAARWRVDLALILVVASGGVLVVPSLGRPGAVFGACFFAALAMAGVVLTGGVIGLPEVPPRLWGGLMLTLVITVVGLAASVPLGVLLALGRRSELPVIRALCVVFIELWRGVPLITVLFMASVMLPLFLPEGVETDKLVRALIGVSLFAAAYMAEVVRGGLQAVPRGQAEAAMALGLGYWQTMGLVVLPQALRHVIPGLINTVIGLFKDTTLVLVIGMFDFLGVIQAALTDPEWLGFALEGYVFAGLVYWVICFGLSRLSLAIERRGVGATRVRS